MSYAKLKEMTAEKKFEELTAEKAREARRAKMELEESKAERTTMECVSLEDEKKTVVEIARSDGSTMTIHHNGQISNDLFSLCRVFLGD